MRTPFPIGRLRIALLSAAILPAISVFVSARADSVVELSSPPSSSTLDSIRSIPGVRSAERFVDVGDPYFRRLVRIGADDRDEKSVERALLLRGGVRRIDPITRAEIYSLEVPPTARPIGNDPLSIYQWGLSNQGQILHRDVDDLHEQRLVGVPGIDVGWKAFRDRYGSSLSETVKVAVVDSGVALEHPDLKDVLLPGWNFTTQDLKGDDQPYDDLGHGTHVAGIIAAAAGNGIGGRGLGENLRIIPVKVLTASEAAPGTPGSPKMILSDRITQGILYAVKAGAQVINLSLGWPKSMDTAYLRQSIKIAQNRGAIVVAAAGNNSHDGTIFPCAYDGVVCVGAYSVDGSYAPFSNFGGHVDVSAPGDSILSTIPTKLTPVLFRMKGYDFLNGTSQAAPFVSGSLALLRALYPKETPLESIRRIFETAVPDGRTLHGRIRLDLAAEATPGETLEPNLKPIDSVPFDVSTRTFSIDLGFRALTGVSAGTIVEVRDESGASFDRTRFDVPATAAGATTSFRLTGRVDSGFPPRGTLVVTIVPPTPLAPKTFRKTFNWIRSFSSDPEVRTTPFDPSIPANRIGLVAGTQVAPQISTLDSAFSTSGIPRYFNVRRDGSSTVISFFRKTGDRMTMDPNPISFSDSEQIVDLLRIDANYDGVPDLLVVELEKDSQGEILDFCYYDEDQRPLFYRPCFGWRPSPELLGSPGSDFTENLLRPSTYSFLPASVPAVPSSAGSSKIALPAFFSNGSLPIADRNPDPFDSDPGTGRTHLYAFSPTEDGGLSLRALDSFSETEKIRSGLKLEWDDPLRILSGLVQNEREFRSGTVSALFGSGRGYGQTLTVARFGRDSTGNFEDSLSAADLGGLQPAGMLASPVFSIGPEGFDPRAATAYFGLYSSMIASTTIWGGPGGEPARTSIYRHPYPLDDLLSLSSAYETPSADLAFYLSKNKLVLSGRNRADGRIFSDSIPLYRYSFIQGRLFSELYYPITAKVGGVEEPALYLDRSQISASEISVITVSGERFQDNGALHYSIPENCRALNPAKPDGKSSPYEVTLLCVDGAASDPHFSLKSLPLVLH